ncbi:MAG: alkaline phosphatase [Planctomycetes bacterium]|nr:alkaline phosphatase [Planctomycetota bacterium]
MFVCFQIRCGWLLALAGLCVSLGGTAAGDDFVRQMQIDAVAKGQAAWGHWGINPDRYSSHRTHSNRLIPVYTFGAKLTDYTGTNSAYRDPKLIERLYGQLPASTLNPTAAYCDQTDIYYLQRAALEAGKKYIVLIVFDGLDWDTTRAAAIYSSGKVGYDSERGNGLHFLDYQLAPTDFGYFVTSPHNDGTKVDVNGQVVTNVGGKRGGGYDARLGGATPWSAPSDAGYLLGQSLPGSTAHPYTDSASSATSLTCGIKTYNDAINVDYRGRQFKSIAHLAQQKGYRVGTVTSVPLSHATPAAAYAHNVWRSDYQDIARDMLGLRSVSHKETPQAGLDVVIGTGWGAKRKEDSEQGTNFVPGNPFLAEADMAAADVGQGGKYRVVQRQADVDGAAALAKSANEAAAKGERLLGFFGTAAEHLPYATADGGYEPAPSIGAAAEQYSDADLKENPRLKDMAAAALTVLSAGDKPFWLMIEAGDVDWACHANNIDNAIGAIRSGDDAFRTVAQWLEKRNAWKDAVVIVTADHGHYFVLRDPKAFTGR